jgi:hypothetical protein
VSDNKIMLYTTPDGVKRVDEMTREELLVVIDEIAAETNRLRMWARANDEMRRLHRVALGY